VRPAHVAPHGVGLALLLGWSASGFSAPAPTAADLARCANIADSAARLACYDAVTANKSNATAAAAATTTPAPAAAPAPAATPAPSAPSAPAAPTPAAAAFSSDPKNFGFTEAQRAPAAAQAAAPKAITAHIAKVIDTRWGPSYAVLDNGQTWEFVDSDQQAGLRPQDAVTIKRGTLGSFLLVTPSHHSYHVRRTQ
jgi:hypothetical protein